MTTTEKWGAIFDWDGVIVDSSKYHEKSWDILAEENKYTLPPGFFKKSFGMKNEKIIPEMLQWSNDPARIREFSLRKEELYRELLKKDAITALPGVYSLLKELREAGGPCIIGSSTHRLNITTALSILKLEEYFPEFVSSENVTHGKPHPEVFLLAGEKIHVSPTRCIVFEDAVVGVQAARAARMKVVALTTTHPANYFTDADVVVENLSCISLSQLEKILEEKK